MPGADAGPAPTDAALDAIAMFTLTIEFSPGVQPGSARVVDANNSLSCLSNCSRTFPAGTMIQLGAVPDSGVKFHGWGGACTGTQPCSFTLTADTTVTAEFSYLYNYMFVTSQRFLPTEIASGANANALCQAAANAGDPRLAGRNYIAWLNAGTSPIYMFNGNTSWIRLDGRPFARKQLDLYTGYGHVLYPGIIDENGTNLMSVTPTDNHHLFVYTGTTSNGQLAPNHCSYWTSSTTGEGDGGMADHGGRAWASGSQRGCSVKGRLYCLGMNFSNTFPPPPPLPAAARRAFVVRVEQPGGGGVAALDQACQAAATAATLPGTYKALIATQSASAASRFSATGGPWYRVDGIIAIDDPTAFLAGGLPLAPIVVRADGTVDETLTHVATGSARQDQTSTTTCEDWTSTTGTYPYGRPMATSTTFWTPFATSLTEQCSAPAGVYCLQE